MTKTAKQLADDIRRDLDIISSQRFGYEMRKAAEETIADNLDALLALAQASQARADGGAEMDIGPWAVTEAGNVISADFKHDVTLGISGDFGDKDTRLAYGRWLAAKLNATPPGNATQAAGAREPLTQEQLFRLIEQSGAPYRKPVQQINRFTGEEETVYVMTEEFSEFKFARLIERAHGIASPAVELKKD